MMLRNSYPIFLICCIAALLLGCDPEPTDNPADTLIDEEIQDDIVPETAEDTSQDTSPNINNGFETVARDDWTDTAVRKVLHTFAFGGMVSDDQIDKWANMSPRMAIREIISFDQINPLLGSLEEGEPTLPSGRFQDLSASWSGDDEENRVLEDHRNRFILTTWNAPIRIWYLATSRVNLNPVRQRIGFFETNDHLAANQVNRINNWQILRYYDDIMDGLEAELPYQEVLAQAALSAAIAMQYNHKDNKFVNAKFSGNEDFGREFYQLFFGILGTGDPEYHEFTTIRNTSKALTDMTVPRIEEEGNRYSEEVVFGTEFHYPSSLEVLGEEIQGETAKEKIEAIAELAINHPESLDNLPVLIIRFLADDNLDDTKIEVLRHAWSLMDDKNLLFFLRNYATSTIFHSPTRVKYWSSMERNITTANLTTLSSHEAYSGYYDPYGQVSREGVEAFRPFHDVFGGQTGIDASQSGFVFQTAWNQSVERYTTYSRIEDGNYPEWKKDWSLVIPAGEDGNYRVKGVAEWLWQHYIADGLKNFGKLERAYVYSLLGAGIDFSLFVDENNPNAVFSEEDLETRGDLVELYSDMELAILPLNHEDPDKKRTTNSRIGLAINFIIVTPYAFCQEGK